MLLNQIVAMIFMVFLGFVAAKLGVVSQEDGRGLTRININILVPCALIDGFQTEFQTDKLVGMLAVAFSTIVIYAVFLVLAQGLKRIGFTPGEQASVLYANSGNLIMPLVLNTLGREYMIYICAYLLVQNTLLWTHCRGLMSGERGMDLKKGMLNANMISIYVGLVLFLLRIDIPGPIGTAMETLGGMVGPMAMVVIGIVMSRLNFKAALSSIRIYQVVALRLLVFPLVVIAVLLAVTRLWNGPDSANILTVALLCSSGPSASLISQMAQLYESKEIEHVSFINAVSTILCAVTIPLMCGLFQVLAK